MKVGAIAYRKTPKGAEVCLVSSLRHKGTLTFPKGNVKQGETLSKAVKRELFEEAGLRGKIKNKKRPFCTQMSFGKREPVFYFLLKITGMAAAWPESKRRKRIFTTVKGMKKLQLGHAPKKLRRELSALRLPGKAVEFAPDKIGFQKKKPRGRLSDRNKKSDIMTAKMARKLTIASARDIAGDTARDTAGTRIRMA